MDDSKIVSLTEVVRRIAVLSDVDEETSREFMQAFSRVLIDALLNKDSVDIRAIGRFSEDEHTPGSVKFEASLPLASVVNRPFSCFDPVELDCSEEELTLQAVDNQEEGTLQKSTPENLPPLPPEIQPHEDKTLVENVVEERFEPEMAVAGDEPEKIEPEEAISVTEDEVSADSEPTTVKIDDRKPLQVEIVGGEDTKKRHPLAGWIFSLGLVVGLCIGFVAGIFLYDYIFPTDPRNYIADDIDADEVEVVDLTATGDGFKIMPDSTAVTDSVPAEADNSAALQENAEQKAAISTVVSTVTDTVAPGRFLASMARKHYGSYVFWVYIYEENRDKIADPDNVSVGTVVVIPDASKYGIDAASAESINKAKAKASEIASKKR